MRDRLSKYNVDLISKLELSIFHEQPSIDITQSIFSISPNIPRVFRLFAATYLTVIFFTNGIIHPYSALINFVYLTRNGYFYSWLYFMLINQYTFSNHFRTYKFSKYWIECIFQLAISLQLTITLMYWLVLFQGQQTGYDLFEDISFHAAPLVLLTIDFVMNPYRFLHINFMPVIVLGSIYMLLINLPYSLIVEPVYPVIDWVSFWSYLYTVIAFGVSYMMYRVGGLVYKKVKKPRVQKLMKEGENPLLASEQFD